MNNKTIVARDCRVIEGYFYIPNNYKSIQEIFSKLDITSNNSFTINTSSATDNSTLIVEDKDITILENSSIGYKTIYNSLIETILTSNIEEPKSFKDVLNNKDKDYYLEAMKLEIDNLIKNNTWNIITTSKDSNNKVIKPIKGRWVLTKKLNLDGSINKYKARWVAKGFLQKYNINYKETFASTSKPSLIRLLLSIFNYLDWEIY